MNEIVVTYNKDRRDILRGESWVYADTLNLSDVLGCGHNEVLKKVRQTLKDYNIEDGELNSQSSNDPKTEYINKNTEFVYSIAYYKNSQNKWQPFYKLSKDLLILVVFSFRKLERAQEIQKLYIAKFNEMEKELHWWRARYLGIDVRNEVTDAIKEYIEDPKWYDYKNFTDLIYKSLFGKNTKTIRLEKGLKKNTNIRPHLNNIELEQVKALESEMSILLSYGFNYEKISNMMKVKYKNSILKL